MQGGMDEGGDFEDDMGMGMGMGMAGEQKERMRQVTITAIELRGHSLTLPGERMHGMTRGENKSSRDSGRPSGDTGSGNGQSDDSVSSDDGSGREEKEEETPRPQPGASPEEWLLYRLKNSDLFEDAPETQISSFTTSNAIPNLSHFVIQVKLATPLKVMM